MATQSYTTSGDVTRATLEDVLDFDGDEQDILSMYLTNGLWFDPEALVGQRLQFFEADSLVRVPKTPRDKRDVFDSPGVQLSPLWRAICKELYNDKTFLHRFDVLNVILNQFPPALFDVERRIRRFRRGVPHKGQDMLIARSPIGARTFVLGCHLAKTMPDPNEWQEKGRSVVARFLEDGRSVDCATLIFRRRSKETTHDGVSFYRYAVARSYIGAYDNSDYAI